MPDQFRAVWPYRLGVTADGDRRIQRRVKNLCGTHAIRRLGYFVTKAFSTT